MGFGEEEDGGEWGGGGCGEEFCGGGEDLRNGIRGGEVMGGCGKGDGVGSWISWNGALEENMDLGKPRASGLLLGRKKR